MAYIIEWTLEGLTKTNQENLNDVIIGTRWKVKATDENDGASGAFVGATPFKPSEVSVDSFTEYNELTEEIVLGWVKNVVSGSNMMTNYWDHIYERIELQINEQKNQKIEVGTSAFPWVMNAESGSI
jgi:hypothetical protein